MGCAYNEAQVRATLFKKWMCRSQSQLEWTQVLQTPLSPAFDDPSSSSCPVRPPLQDIYYWKEARGGVGIKLWRGGHVLDGV